MNYFKLGLMILYEPQNAFNMIKANREKIHFYVPIAILISAIALRVISIFIIHYPLAKVSPENANFASEVLNITLPILSWVIGIYLVIAIRDGECTFKETAVAVGYCLVPYIVFVIPVSLLSNIMSLGELGLYNDMTLFIWVWVILLMLYSLMHMNSYTISQTVIAALLGVFTCVFVWAVLFLIYILLDKIQNFVVEVFSEYRILFR